VNSEKKGGTRLMCSAGTRNACVALLFAVWFSPHHSYADNKEELQALRARIERLQSDLTAAESSRNEAADALKVSERAISEANRGLHELGREKQALSANLRDIGRRSQAMAADVAVQRLLLDRLIRHQYMYGSTDNLRLMLEGRDAAAVNRRIHYFTYISKLRTEMIRRMQKSLADLARLQSEALEQKGSLAANEADQRRASKTLENEKQARRRVLDQIAGLIRQNRREIGRLKRDEDRLSKLVEQLGKVLSTKPTARTRAPGQVVEDVADTSFIGKNFQALKGKLKLPVRGELSNRFGSPREEGGTTWRGLFIRSDTGQSVRAVADGRVVYADWLRGFGNLLIVDHGSGYMSLYGNNESILKQVGEAIQSGEPVAAVGDSGGAGESGLYFELRHKGKPFDPMRWVGR
jgi:septal ring factor EnvC (AmiA/AmiB activator)